MSVSKLNDILTSGAGGVLLLIPKNLPQESRESVQALEEFLLSAEIEVPVYFAEESEDLDYLVENLQGVGNEKSGSAAQGEFERTKIHKVKVGFSRTSGAQTMMMTSVS